MLKSDKDKHTETVRDRTGRQEISRERKSYIERGGKMLDRTMTGKQRQSATGREGQRDTYVKSYPGTYICIWRQRREELVAVFSRPGYSLCIRFRGQTLHSIARGAPLGCSTGTSTRAAVLVCRTVCHRRSAPNPSTTANYATLIPRSRHHEQTIGFLLDYLVLSGQVYP